MRTETPGLVLPIGPPGSGKSAWADRQAGNLVVLGLDRARALLGAHAGDQTATAAAIRRCTAELVRALADGQQVIFDATNATDRDRANWIGIAQAHQAPVQAVLFRTPLAVCLARNKRRSPETRVPAKFVRTCWRRINALTAPALRAEGIGDITALHPDLAKER